MVFIKILRLTKKKEDTAYVFRQLKLIKNRKDSDKPKKMRIYHIQVNWLSVIVRGPTVRGFFCDFTRPDLHFFQIKDWLSSSGNPVPASLERFRQTEDFLESLLTERNYSHPLALVSADKSTYVGVFILSRIMLHTTRHGGKLSVECMRSKISMVGIPKILIF